MQQLLVLEESKKAREVFKVDSELMSDLGDGVVAVDRAESGEEIGANRGIIEREEAQVVGDFDAMFDPADPDPFA